jgi:hypothetical protein
VDRFQPLNHVQLSLWAALEPIVNVAGKLCLEPFIVYPFFRRIDEIARIFRLWRSIQNASPSLPRIA